MQQMIMLNNRPQDAYKKQDVLTASPIDLIIMLYDALKKNLVLGRRNIEKKNLPGAHHHLMKAQMIITELINSLDMNYEISDELLELYEYSLRTLEQANFKKDAELIGPIIEIVDEIRSAWKEISTTNIGAMHPEEERA